VRSVTQQLKNSQANLSQNFVFAVVSRCLKEFSTEQQSQKQHQKLHEKEQTGDAMEIVDDQEESELKQLFSSLNSNSERLGLEPESELGFGLELWDLVLGYMIRTSSFSSLTFSTLVQTLILHNKQGLILESLLSLTDITSEHLVLLLQYCLDQLLNNQSSCHLIHFLIDAIICRPRNKPVMQQSLKSLSLDHTLKLLHLLKGRLKDIIGLESQKQEPEPEPDQKRKTPEPLPKVGDVIEWTSLLLDSHFADLVVGGESVATVVELKSIVEQFLGFSHSVQHLKTLLAHFVAQRTRKSTKPPLPAYSVEFFPLCLQ